MNLSAAFDIQRGEIVALIGAGGKTSMLVALGGELRAQGWRVLATTTTRISEDQLSLFPAALALSDGLDQIAAALAQHGCIFVYSALRGGKAYGITPEQVGWLRETCAPDVLLIEADGARGLPLKAPRSHEPVIPPETTLVVAVASLSVLGQPLDDEHVFNAGAIVERCAFPAGEPVKAAWVAQILGDNQLGLRGVPASARAVVFLNDAADGGYRCRQARRIARGLLAAARLERVVLGSTRTASPVAEVQRRVGAVVLAAGLARRMGQPKVLLPWRDGRTIIEHIIDQLAAARVDHITVVTGHRADEVRQLAEQKGAQVVFNPDYATGDMLSSLKTGLRALPAQTAAALVALGDQPRIKPRIVRRVLQAYAQGLGQIVAPSFQMRRGHPILIDRRYWGEILDLPEDGAPRDVINAHAEAAAYVDVDNDSVLRDVDTPEEYQQERRRAGLSD